MKINSFLFTKNTIKSLAFFAVCFWAHGDGLATSPAISETGFEHSPKHISPPKRGLWNGQTKEGLTFCLDQFEKAVKGSDKETIITTFTSEQEFQTLVKKAGTKERASELALELAQDRIVARRNAYTLAIRGARSASEKDKNLLEANKVVCNDLNILTSNEQCGGVQDSIFAARGISPLKTQAGHIAAASALINPETNLSILEARKASIKELAQNPALLEKIEQQLVDFQKYQDNSLGRLLNPQAKTSLSTQGTKIITHNEFDKIESSFEEVVAKPAVNQMLFAGIIFLYGLGSLIQKVGTECFRKQLLSGGLLNQDLIMLKMREEASTYILTMALPILYFFFKKPMVEKFFKTKFFKRLSSQRPINESKLINISETAKLLKGNTDFLNKWMSAPIEFVKDVAIIAPLVLTALAVPLKSKKVRDAIVNIMTTIAMKTYPQTIGHVGADEQFVRQVFSEPIEGLASLLTLKTAKELGMIPVNILRSMPSLFKFLTTEVSEHPYRTTAAVLVIGTFIAQWVVSTKNVYDRSSSIRQARESLKSLRAMIESARSCETALYGNAQTIEAMLDPKLGVDSFGNACWPMLNSSTFAQTAKDSAVCNQGAVIACYKYLGLGASCDTDGKVTLNEGPASVDQLSDVMATIGEIDLVSSLARAVVDHSKLTNKICLPIFLDQKRASFKGSKIWHPVIGKQAVANDMALGVEGSPLQTEVVMGGNGTGKSVLVVSSTLAAYLPQCIGIAMASSVTMTPVTFLTQIKTQDDVKDATSLFRAQIRQLAKFCKKIQDAQNSDTDEKYDVTMDESLSGTKVQYATAILASLFKNVFAKAQKCYGKFASHLEALAEMIEEISGGTAKPCQIVCKGDANGNYLSSTYKKGPYTKNPVAFASLRQAFKDLGLHDSALVVALEEFRKAGLTNAEEIIRDAQEILMA